MNEETQHKMFLELERVLKYDHSVKVVKQVSEEVGYKIVIESVLDIINSTTVRELYLIAMEYRTDLYFHCYDNKITGVLK